MIKVVWGFIQSFNLTSCNIQFAKFHVNASKNKLFSRFININLFYNFNIKTILCQIKVLINLHKCDNILLYFKSVIIEVRVFLTSKLSRIKVILLLEGSFYEQIQSHELRKVGNNDRILERRTND